MVALSNRENVSWHWMKAKMGMRMEQSWMELDGVGLGWIGRYETRSVDGLMVECRTTYASGCLERLPHLLLTSMYSLLDVVPLP